MKYKNLLYRISSTSPPPFNNDDEIRVLGIGTGTGSWAKDLRSSPFPLHHTILLEWIQCCAADNYTLSEVLGTNIAYIQPAMIPPNIILYIHAAESSWEFLPHDEDFHLVRDRDLTTCFKNPRFGVGEAFEILGRRGYWSCRICVSCLVVKMTLEGLRWRNGSST